LPEPVPDRESRLDVQTFEREFKAQFDDLEKWMSDNSPELSSESARSLWDFSVELSNDAMEVYSSHPSDDPYVNGLALEVETKFKTPLKTADKNTLKREYVALKFGHLQAMKKIKYQKAAHVQYTNILQKQTNILLRELKLVNVYVQKLKQENQSLCRSHHHMINKNKSTEDDLKFQALFAMAQKYCVKQKVGAFVFNEYGFAISKSLLTKDVKCIRKAKDFGPNSVNGGRQFFMGFFRELSKSPAESRCEELTQIKNNELVYNDLVDKSVANDKSSLLTGPAKEHSANPDERSP